MLIYKICICWLATLTVCHADTFTSIREMEKLFDLEQNLARELDDYLKLANFELEIMERHQKELAKIDSEITDIESYADNPVNAYSVVKRLIKEWPSTSKLMSSSPFFQEEEDLPQENMLLDMIKGIVDWQLENKVKTKTLARGKIEGIKPHANLTANDCFDIGIFCYNTKRLDLAVEWFREALYKIKNNNDYSASPVELLEYMFLAKCRKGNLKGSLAAYQTLTTDGAKWYSPSKELKKEYNRQSVKKCIAAALETKKTKPSKTSSYLKNYDISHDLCRPSTKVMDGVSCYYFHYYNPYLMLGPIKLEQLSYSPHLVLLYDAFRPLEILDVKEATLTALETLTLSVNGPVSMPNEDVGTMLTKRMSTYTGLSFDMFAEGDNMVSVLGPDAGYKTFKMFENEDLQRIPVGQIIYFLSDVAKGGYTVFPSIKVAVAPQKGAVLYYLKNQQEAPLERGECPILMGSKWVMTKTISEEEDEPKAKCPFHFT